MQNFTKAVIETISRIPRGKVISYGRIALIAGNPFGARQVSRILHAMSQKHNLPWHRVINSKGMISLPTGGGYEGQRRLLEEEGIALDEKGRIDFEIFGWDPGKIALYHSIT
ncbi:MAG: MGMT family protein [Candidatus Marinimicrobia bacterium]|nr:MGMT family protein [Candidatus Neomarinimicrobiota bacterium]